MATCSVRTCPFRRSVQMIGRMKRLLLLCLWASVAAALSAQPKDLVWKTPSLNSAGSMPCGGGDIGLNVWVEQDGVLRFYLFRSGSFDENNTLLKAGKFVLQLSPALRMDQFRQTLHLNDGYVSVEDGSTCVDIWVDTDKPVVHVEVKGMKGLRANLHYENWRSHDRALDRTEGQQCSYKWTAKGKAFTSCDSVMQSDEMALFYHENGPRTIFDETVSQQGLDSVASSLYNPLRNLIFGGRMRLLSKTGSSRHYTITMATLQGVKQEWLRRLNTTEDGIRTASDKKRSRKWWNDFWKRSFIESEGGTASTMARNYTLFRYMLGCNAKSDWPTKFNGGLFTFDPEWVDAKCAFTPDFRKWGGGTHTAQNQRLVYWPMLRSGDFDMLTPQFEFYRRILETAQLRSKVYWNHQGACFAEQIENFGLPNYAEYGTKRPEYYDKGLEYNQWLEYEWDTVLEFCLMILLDKEYSDADISPYIPLIKSVLQFFDSHYQLLASQRGRKSLDEQGHLVIYPGSACETYKMAYNPASTICALRKVAEKYVELVDTAYVQSLLQRLPPLPFRECDGRRMLAPAVVWERVNNVETPQLYPVFPWGIYGVGRPDIEVARNTYLYDPDALKFRSHEGWKQDNIWAACLGLTDEAVRLNRQKLQDGPYRYPAFWGPGFDWSPDHNWGGSGMIGLQSMLLQEVGDSILLFPAWPKDEDVHFKLHASKKTTVEATLRNGEITQLSVEPQSRRKDIIIWH